MRHGSSIGRLPNYPITKFLRCLLFHLLEFQLHWSRASENRDHHLQRLAIIVDFVDDACKRCEWAFSNAYGLILLELDLELRLLSRLTRLVDDLLDFFVRKR